MALQGFGFLLNVTPSHQKSWQVKESIHGEDSTRQVKWFHCFSHLKMDKMEDKIQIVDPLMFISIHQTIELSSQHVFNHEGAIFERKNVQIIRLVESFSWKWWFKQVLMVKIQWIGLWKCCLHRRAHYDSAQGPAGLEVLEQSPLLHQKRPHCSTKHIS